jgi:indolepyruvate ferredoxin oxidoreductase beta subunit
MGKCDVLVGMEPSEALRNITYLSKSSLVILNTAVTIPFTNHQAGNLLTTNIVMLGALFGTEKLPIGIDTIKETIRARFPDKATPVNIKAFDLGYQACQQALK